MNMKRLQIIPNSHLQHMVLQEHKGRMGKCIQIWSRILSDEPIRQT